MIFGGTINSKLGPFLQAAWRDVASPFFSDEKKFQGGLAYWASGHRLNIKLGIGRLMKDRSPDRTQVVAQAQVFFY